MDLNTKKNIYYAITSILFLAVLSRFFYLQIYKQSIYNSVSEKNRIREVIVQPTRGLMIDRNGIVVVDNIPSYSVYGIPFEMKQSLPLLSEILEIPLEELKRKIDVNSYGKFSRVKLKRQISFEMLSRIEEHKLDLPGVYYEIEPRRSFPSDVRAPHIFGYLGEVDKRLLKQPGYNMYRPGDIVGKKSLEHIYDIQLRGISGRHYIEVDALGREVDKPMTKMMETSAVPGQNLHLTLDAGLQTFLEKRFSEISGGAAVIDSRTGEVLALVSKPDFDPLLFTKPLTPKLWDRLSSDSTKPLFDRMVQSLYPPGSTFKLVLAAAALETGLIEPDWNVTCSGSFRFGSRIFNCWEEDGHGELDLFGAIEQSCNVYFYQLGLKLGLEKWTEYARKLRFGIPTGIDLLEESSGFVPTKSSFDQTYGAGKWTNGLVVNLAVGQGDLLVTPLQMAALAMLIGNKGVFHKFHLLRYLEDPVSHVQSRVSLDPIHEEEISKATYYFLKKAMFEVVNGKKGTGRASQLQNVAVAGKTGTAQNPHGDDHAWFIGFAPFDNPKIAFCVLVENGGSGGGIAAPIAREMLQYFFNKDF